MPQWPYTILREGTAPDTGVPPTATQVESARRRIMAIREAVGLPQTLRRRRTRDEEMGFVEPGPGERRQRPAPAVYRLLPEGESPFVLLPPDVNVRVVGGRPVYEFTGDSTAFADALRRRMPVMPVRAAEGPVFEVTGVSTADPRLVTGRLRSTASATSSVSGSVGGRLSGGTRPSSTGPTLPFTAVALTFGDMAAQTEAAIGQLAGSMSLTSESMRRVFQELTDRLGEAVNAQLRQPPVIFGRVTPPEPPPPAPPPAPPRPTVADIGGERLISFDDEEA